MTPLRQRRLAALFGVCLCVCASAAQAEEAPDASLKSPAWLAPRAAMKPPKAVAAGPTVGLGRSLGVLLVTALLGGSALYLRSKKHQAPKARLAQLRVVSSTKLGGRAQLVLAEVDGRKILLGVTDSSVRKLGWIEANANLNEEEEELGPALRPRLVPAGQDLAGHARARAEPVPAPIPKRSFRDLLASAVGNLGRPDDDSAALTIAAETYDTFTRSAPRAPEAQRPERARRDANPQMIDLEGQAQGLLARLRDPRP
jgi:flagellar biogenesis protein FliO